MRLSQYFLPILRDNPKEAEIMSHQLMLRAGMIRQASAGIYSWLPLGFRVLKKIEQIVREEQERAGAIELLMPTIQSADLWRESGRYDDYGKEMLRITDRGERELLYGPTNEEMINEIFRAGVSSYKDLPRNLFHIQWKFRDEIRPRFGIMRGREFLMKDAYSFDLTEEGARESYNKMFVAYLRTFERLGVKAIPMAADTGPIGGDLSHEFIVLAETGESEVFCHGDLMELSTADKDIDYSQDLQPLINQWTDKYAATIEMHDADKFSAEVPEDKRIATRGIEVGHIFYFGTKYSEAMKCTVQGPDGKVVNLQSGSYGIGVSRLVGAIIEASHDDKGIIWPDSIAPYEVAVINLKSGNEETDAVCEDFYQKLQKAGHEVIYDDRKDSAGAKFATIDLIGIPRQLIVGPRGLKDGEIEVKIRKTGERKTLSVDEALNFLTA
ncbi:MAG: proline--tRNA ligase [Methyloligellaceae bacterium]